MRCGSSTLAMVVCYPPQRAQPSIRTPNTRFRRRSLLIAARRDGDGSAGSGLIPAASLHHGPDAPASPPAGGVESRGKFTSKASPCRLCGSIGDFKSRTGFHSANNGFKSQLRALGGKLIADPNESVLSEEDFEARR